jgi:threonine/homoserine/homoserine lactone efflux protein
MILRSILSITGDYAVVLLICPPSPWNFVRLLRHSCVMIELLGAGVAVGLAVAMPFGPVGLTVVALGRRDWRSGAAAATGVAAADLTWAVVAVACGAVLALHPAVHVWRAAAQAALLVIGVGLVVRGVHQLLVRRSRSTPRFAEPRSAKSLVRRSRSTARFAEPRSAKHRRRSVATDAHAPVAHAPGRYFVALYGLTLPNPLTVAIFTSAAVDVGLSAGAAAPGQRAVFVAAVGLTSLVWQLLLAAMGRHLLTRVGPTASAALTVLGGLLLVAWPVIAS